MCKDNGMKRRKGSTDKERERRRERTRG